MTPPTQPVAVRSDAVQMRPGDYRVTVLSLPSPADREHNFQLYFERISHFGPADLKPMITLSEATVSDHVHLLCRPFSRKPEWNDNRLKSLKQVKPGLWEAVVLDANLD